MSRRSTAQSAVTTPSAGIVPAKGAGQGLNDYGVAEHGGSWGLPARVSLTQSCSEPEWSLDHAVLSRRERNIHCGVGISPAFPLIGWRRSLW